MMNTIKSSDEVCDYNHEESLPPIRLIDFEVFKSCKSFPRYPNSKEVVELNNIDRNNSFVVFVSHCWLRGWDGAEGFDGSPHPDNKTNDKFKLCRCGISMAWNQLAPGMKKCYVWLGNLKAIYDYFIFFIIITTSDYFVQ